MNNKHVKDNNPIFFMEKGKDYTVNPIYIMDDAINSNYKFVITRLTDNGKWVRGGALYYKLDKVEVYTDINNAIFVDLESNTLFIKEYDKVIEQLAPVDPEQRQYIILIYRDNDDNPCTWESMIGRTATYEWIKTNIEWMQFDPESSIVLTENVPYKDAFSVSRFIKHLQNANLVEEEEGFDIDQYRYEDSFSTEGETN